QSLAFENAYAHLQVRSGLEHPVLRIEADAAGPAECVHYVLRISADDLDSLRFSLAFGFDAYFHRHAEEVEVLLNLPDCAKALVVAQAVDGVLVRELRRSCAVHP